MEVNDPLDLDDGRSGASTPTLVVGLDDVKFTPNTFPATKAVEDDDEIARKLQEWYNTERSLSEAAEAMRKKEQMIADAQLAMALNIQLNAEPMRINSSTGGTPQSPQISPKPMLSLMVPQDEPPSIEDGRKTRKSSKARIADNSPIHHPGKNTPFQQQLSRRNSFSNKDPLPSIGEKQYTIPMENNFEADFYHKNVTDPTDKLVRRGTTATTTSRQSLPGGSSSSSNHLHASPYDLGAAMESPITTPNPQQSFSRRSSFDGNPRQSLGIASELHHPLPHHLHHHHHHYKSYLKTGSRSSHGSRNNSYDDQQQFPSIKRSGSFASSSSSSFNSRSRSFDHDHALGPSLPIDLTRAFDKNSSLDQDEVLFQLQQAFTPELEITPKVPTGRNSTTFPLPSEGSSLDRASPALFSHTQQHFSYSSEDASPIISTTAASRGGNGTITGTITGSSSTAASPSVKYSSSNKQPSLRKLPVLREESGTLERNNSLQDRELLKPTPPLSMETSSPTVLLQPSQPSSHKSLLTLLSRSLSERRGMAPDIESFEYSEQFSNPEPTITSSSSSSAMPGVAFTGSNPLAARK